MRRTLFHMCRNITTLRGLQPAATEEEIAAAALQYIRKVSGVQSGPLLASPEFVEAVEAVSVATTTLLEALPPRRVPPPSLPPLRRIKTAN